MVIDDTEMLLIFVEDSLALADPNLQIVTAFTGEEGVRRAEATLPDLVLLDSACETCVATRFASAFLRTKPAARIPVVMMSGHVPEMMATAERFPNVVATIAKPFMSEALVQLVHETLAKGHLPSTPKEKAAQARTVTDQPASAAGQESKPVRHGNGEKPVKKTALAKIGARETPENLGPARSGAGHNSAACTFTRQVDRGYRTNRAGHLARAAAEPAGA